MEEQKNLFADKKAPAKPCEEADERVHGLANSPQA